MNESGELNDAAAKYMSSFPLVTIEKMEDSLASPVCHPSSQALCEEDRIIAALHQIRSYNAETRNH